MNCPKHPKEKMTLLLFSYVCDICDPPKGAVKAAPKVFDGAKATFSVGGIQLGTFDPSKITTAARHDDDGFLLCKTCNNYIIQAVLINYQNTNEAEVDCINGHRDREILRHGDRIFSRYGGHGEYDAVDKKWV